MKKYENSRLKKSLEEPVESDFSKWLKEFDPNCEKRIERLLAENNRLKKTNSKFQSERATFNGRVNELLKQLANTNLINDKIRSQAQKWKKAYKAILTE